MYLKTSITDTESTYKSDIIFTCRQRDVCKLTDIIFNYLLLMIVKVKKKLLLHNSVQKYTSLKLPQNYYIDGYFCNSKWNGPDPDPRMLSPLSLFHNYSSFLSRCSFIFIFHQVGSNWVGSYFMKLWIPFSYSIIMIMSHFGMISVINACEMMGKQKCHCNIHTYITTCTHSFLSWRKRNLLLKLKHVINVQIMKVCPL